MYCYNVVFERQIELLGDFLDYMHLLYLVIPFRKNNENIGITILILNIMFYDSLTSDL